MVKRKRSKKMARMIKFCERCGKCSECKTPNESLVKIMDCLNISDAELCMMIGCERQTLYDIKNGGKITGKFMDRINNYIKGYGVEIE